MRDSVVWIAATAMIAVSPLVPTNSAQAQTRKTITCGSTGGYNYCPVPDLQDAWIDKQYSSAPCVEGKGWQHDTSGIIVDHGCRARFVVVTAGKGGGKPGYDGCHGTGCLVDRPEDDGADANSGDPSAGAVDGCSAAAVNKGYSLGGTPKVSRIVDTYPDSDGYHVEGELQIRGRNGVSTATFLCVWDGRRATVMLGSGL